MGIIGNISFHLGLLSIRVILVLLNLLTEKDVIIVTCASFPKGHFQTSPSWSVDDSDLLKAKEGELVFSVSFVIRFLYRIQLRRTNTQWKNLNLCTLALLCWSSPGLRRGITERRPFISTLPKSKLSFPVTTAFSTMETGRSYRDSFFTLPAFSLPPLLAMLPRLFTHVVKSSRMYLPRNLKLS